MTSCVELVHELPGRWRYRLNSGAPLAWERLEQELAAALPGTQWRWRLNRRCRSLLLECDDPSRQQQGWQSVVAAMERCGATAPPPPVLQVRVQVVRDRPCWLQRLLSAPANLISLLMATGLLSLASLLVLGGILGLLLPLAPGWPLLLLAFLLVEGAIQLRRPFTNPAAAGAL